MPGAHVAVCRQGCKVLMKQKQAPISQPAQKERTVMGKPIVEALVKRGSIAGDGKGSINVSEDLVKVLAILEREGVLKK